MNTYSLDTLPEKPYYYRPIAYIANLSSLDSKGTHWICLFFPINDVPEYFDTFHLDVPIPFQQFMGKKYKRNINIIQHPFSTSCGQHVIYYIWQRCRNKSMEDIMKLYSPKNLLLNDELVNRIVNKNFGLNLSIIDETYLQSVYSEEISM